MAGVAGQARRQQVQFRSNDPVINLTGEWSFAYSEGPELRRFTSVSDLDAAGCALLPCTVPGNFELDLHRNGIIPEPFFGMNIASLTRCERSHVWYARPFTAREMPGLDAELVFEGLDCFADVFLNGDLVGRADNMLIEHVFAVNGLLKGENELLVHIRPAVEEAKKFSYPPSVGALGGFLESLYVRKAPHMYGWDIMPRAVSAGIWRPVTLRFRPKERLETAFLRTLSISGGETAHLALHYTAALSGEAGEGARVEISGRCGDSEFHASQQAGAIGGVLGVSVSGPRLWWPRGRGEQNLYDVTVRLTRGGQELDRLTFTHGIRTIALDRTSVTDASGSGEFCFRVNGERFFALGTNWVPVDAYHSRDAERLPKVLDLAEDIGCNTIRCWGGNVYENDLFYDFCDRRGILVWQDFAMACRYPPRDEAHQRAIAAEARAVVRRLRQHACLALWSGDNEVDSGLAAAGRNPNDNVLTRRVIPDVLKEEDQATPYIPSSPYIDETAFAAHGSPPEDHPWGPRDYYKSDFYRGVVCHFASEMGYHGCPSAGSIRGFISPEKVWPYQDNCEWTLHATDPVPGVDNFGYRVELMASQVRVLFGEVPGNLEDFVFASQASQAEAVKFFIEMFRTGKWRRTGIIWWNLMDGWPQFSDAVVDYYFTKKLAYSFIKRCQQPLLLALREPEAGAQELAACNDSRDAIELQYTVTDAGTGAQIAAGRATAGADAVTTLDRIPCNPSDQRLYVLRWTSASGDGLNHYLAGAPPFDLEQYRRWIAGVTESLRR